MGGMHCSHVRVNPKGVPDLGTYLQSRGCCREVLFSDVLFEVLEVMPLASLLAVMANGPFVRGGF